MRSKPPVVAVSFHWDCHVSPETRSAFSQFCSQVGRLVKDDSIRVIGHGHPRILGSAAAPMGLARWYARAGIEVVYSFEEVCQRADLYVNDASSTLFEFASTGRPVVVMNPDWYRREIHHGLRFWEASTVGVNVGPKGSQREAIAAALADPPAQQAAREAALDLVYAYRSGGAERAAAVLVDWAG
jgi:CDP-glycerol glycerophosphotransferase (TagB/SpsB family)